MVIWARVKRRAYLMSQQQEQSSVMINPADPIEQSIRQMPQDKAIAMVDRLVKAKSAATRSQK